MYFVDNSQFIFFKRNHHLNYPGYSVLKMFFNAMVYRKVAFDGQIQIRRDHSFTIVTNYNLQLLTISGATKNQYWTSVCETLQVIGGSLGLCFLPATAK